MCAGKIATARTSLRAVHPAIADEWHQTKNSGLTPDEVMPHSNKKVWWKCRHNPSHVWKAVIQSRADGCGCPMCRLVPRSRDEIVLACELLTLLEFDLDNHSIVVADRVLDVDIIIPSLRLIVEYDGSYWHQGKENADRRKSNRLREAGWRVIRVREAPLEKTSPDDVVVPQGKHKVVADVVLRQIQEVCNVKIHNLDHYLNDKALLNFKRAEAVIEELLARSNARRVQTR